ncbi:PREDICTED: programmed cell death protein 10-like [Amphimedon queenslandica]|uniref:Programmed cell death protein 10 dimerisation domain-containing protein n=1 Tax=Amphimedon queenslandica TaxID=400682 RepID=A0A1X7THD5_AMPQE|nr:PREDICTED: programmed cell death protein 10-like [Amphimedon queenslandica]|eukprot:XP_003390554.1 PREDICTED: programmed cell death protein 10-like [Amphimedon queenslandica]
MDDKGAVASLALHAVIEPIFKDLELEDRNIAAVQTLRSAFTKAEKCHPGLSQQFLGGVLDAEGVVLNLHEVLLRLAGSECPEYVISADIVEFQLLQKKATTLKIKLSHIPDQIQDRSEFLQTIRDIASAIKEVLDAVNELSQNHQDLPRMSEYKKTLDNQKRVFVRSSRSFSDTLKKYFKDGRAEHVYISANRLINHTNTLLATYKSISS